MKRRDLFVTMEMLRADGLDTDVRVDDGRIEVRLENRKAVFRTPHLGLAADWLAACAVLEHPASSFARMWLLLARLGAARVPSEDRT